MTRRESIATLVGTLLAQWSPGAPVAEAVSPPAMSLKGWTLYDPGEFFEVRLLIDNGQFVEIFPYMRDGDLIRNNPEWEVATHKVYAGKSPSEGWHYIVCERNKIPEDCTILPFPGMLQT